MSILVHQERPIDVSTVLGSWTANTVPQNGLLQQIVVKSTTNSTMFDFSLTDLKNVVVYERTDATGEISEEIVLPINGVYTMRISNATRDEVFTVALIVREG